MYALVKVRVAEHISMVAIASDVIYLLYPAYHICISASGLDSTNKSM